MHAVKTGEMIFISGQLGLNPADGTLPEGVEAQTKQSLENLKTILEGCGSDLDHVVKTVDVYKRQEQRPGIWREDHKHIPGRRYKKRTSQ